MIAETPVDALTRELAQYLESAEIKKTPKAAQKKHFRQTLESLQPLRGDALPVEIEGFYNVGAWYSLFGYPPKFPSWANPADSAIFATSRHVYALTILKEEWRQPYTLSKIREAVRDVIPLPIWPGRDFLDKLAKIAGAVGAGRARYSLDRFLTEFPHFLHSKVGKVTKSQYFKREGRRCVLNPELDEFYDTVVQPWIIGPSRTSSRKRRKADVAGRSINTGQHVQEVLSDGHSQPDDASSETSSQAEDEPPEVERSRRFIPKNIQQQTFLRSSLGIEDTASTSSRSQSQHGEDSLIDNNTQVDEPELEIDQSLIDEDTGMQIFSDNNSPTQIEIEQEEQHRATMGRRAKGTQTSPDEHAQKQVDNAFEHYFTRASRMTKGVQYLLEYAEERQSLRRRIETATAAYEDASNATAEVSSEVSSLLPADMDLTQAITKAEAQLSKFITYEDRIREHHTALEALADEMDADDMGIPTTTSFNDSALVARRTEYEQELAQLRDLAADLAEKQAIENERKKELDVLMSEIIQLEVDRDETEELYRKLRNDDWTNAAVAKFKASRLEEQMAEQA